jgi:hypothetical protein
LAGAGEVGATSRNRKAQAAAAPPPPVFDRENTSLEKVIAYNYDPKKFFQRQKCFIIFILNEIKVKLYQYLVKQLLPCFRTILWV